MGLRGALVHMYSSFGNVTFDQQSGLPTLGWAHPTLSFPLNAIMYPRVLRKPSVTKPTIGQVSERSLVWGTRSRSHILTDSAETAAMLSRRCIYNDLPSPTTIGSQTHHQAYTSLFYKSIRLSLITYCESSFSVGLVVITN